MLLTPPLAAPAAWPDVTAAELSVAQDHKPIQQKFFNPTFLDSPCPSKVTLMMCGDIISSLPTLEKVGAQPASTSP